MCPSTDLWEPWAGNRPGPPGTEKWGEQMMKKTRRHSRPRKAMPFQQAVESFPVQLALPVAAVKPLPPGTMNCI